MYVKKHLAYQNKRAVHVLVILPAQPTGTGIQNSIFRSFLFIFRSMQNQVDEISNNNTSLQSQHFNFTLIYKIVGRLLSSISPQGYEQQYVNVDIFLESQLVKKR